MRFERRAVHLPRCFKTSQRFDHPFNSLPVGLKFLQFLRYASHVHCFLVILRTLGLSDCGDHTFHSGPAAARAPIRNSSGSERGKYGKCAPVLRGEQIISGGTVRTFTDNPRRKIIHLNGSMDTKQGVERGAGMHLAKRSDHASRVVLADEKAAALFQPEMYHFETLISENRGLIEGLLDALKSRITLHPERSVSRLIVPIAGRQQCSSSIQRFSDIALRFLGRNCIGMHKKETFDWIRAIIPAGLRSLSNLRSGHRTA
jgi:hypothetical protein